MKIYYPNIIVSNTAVSQVLQIVPFSVAAVAGSGAAGNPFVITNGASLGSYKITLQSASSKLAVIFSWGVSTSATTNVGVVMGWFDADTSTLLGAQSSAAYYSTIQSGIIVTTPGVSGVKNYTFRQCRQSGAFTTEAGSAVFIEYIP